MTNSIPEIGTSSDLIFIIGSNTAECHPLVARQVIRAQERGAKLIVADPRRTEMANKADIWLRVPAGYNIPLINALIQVIIEEQLVSRSFVQEHTEGFDDLARAVADYAPASVEGMTGIPAADLIQSARLYAGAKAASIIYCMGVTQFSFGTGTVVDLSNLAAITGNFGRPGTGVNPLRGQNNVQGACDMGCLPNSLPGYLSVTAEENRKRFEADWGVSLPQRPGLKIPEAADAILDGRLRALYVFGENPIMSDPDSNHLRHALEHLDLLIVQDIFLTETARLADVVLPAACWGEKDGLFSNTERRVQRVRQAVEPPGEARPDWQVFMALARRLGYEQMDYPDTQAIWDEVRRLVPEKFGGISYRRLDQERGICWPCPVKDHPGTPILYQNGKFSTPSGKAGLRPVLFAPEGLPEAKISSFPQALAGQIAERPDEEFPFVLTTGRRVYHYHTGTMTRRSAPLNQVGPGQLVEINPLDAARLGIGDGDPVKLTTRRGQIAARAWLTERVPEKTVFTTFHFWEANVNELTNRATDPVAGIPEIKVAATRVERISLLEAKQIYEEKRKLYLVDVEQEVLSGQ